MLPNVVLVSGTVAFGILLFGATQAVGFRGIDGLDTRVVASSLRPRQCRVRQHVVALGSFCLASGWAILRRPLT
jgi:hypothetical protein